MNKNQLLLELERIEQKATTTKWGRFFNHPLKYIYAIGFRMFYYPITHKELQTSTKVFWREDMIITLPSSTDIFLLKGKSHSSEIRLARFLIHQLQADSSFLDIGAHYGFYSLLVSKLTKSNIHSIEASKDSYDILVKNTKNQPKIKASHCAVSNTNENITFYEFDSQYSEYSSTDVSQYENESWFKTHPPKKIFIAGTTIDHYTTSNNFYPNFIKMDVEGAEYIAIQGGATFFQQNSPILVMEYLAPERQNTAHQNAVELLRSWGYQSYSIQNDGSLRLENNLNQYLRKVNLDSDNIVLKK